MSDMSTCDKCGRKYPSASSGVIHKCQCSGGYMVPDTSEALTAPNDDAVAKWKVADASDIASMVRSLRQYPADELAKHGITLAPEKDWATELWADIWEARGSPDDAELVRQGETSIADRAAIALIRERVVLKGEG